MARAMWKGVIRLEGLEVPVKLYSGVEDRGIHFRLLHAPDRTPVRQRMVDPGSGDVIPYDEVRRGYPTGAGEYVVLTEDELAELEPRPGRDIEILRFVDPAAIDDRWYDRPYLLGPDGDPGSLQALRAALEGEEKEGVARWTMRKRAYTGALAVRDDGLALITLRNADALVPLSELQPPAGRELSRAERDMARQLIDALADEFEPEAYTDRYRERVLELVRAKAEGKAIRIERPRPKRAPDEESLTQVLKASLEAMEGRDVA